VNFGGKERMMVRKKQRSNTKKRILLLLFFISIFFLSGCWDKTEVNNLAIITGFAFDLTDDNKIEVTAQVFVPKSLSSGGGQDAGGGSSGQVVSVAGQIGENITDALSKLQGKLPREIFWGQTKVFIFGEKLAEGGLQKHLDFLQRQPKVKGNAFVYVSEGKAKSVFDIPANIEEYSAEVLRDLTDMKVGMNVTLQELDTMLIGMNQATALPYVRIGTQEKTYGEPIQFVYIDGTAVFQKDRMVGKITEEETRGILWLRDELREYTVIEKLEGEEGFVAIRSNYSSLKLHPEINNGTWKMHVEIETEGWIIQNETKLDTSNPAVVKRMERAYGQNIENRIKQALEIVQHNLKADVTNFAKEFHRKYPQQMKQEKKNWDEKYPEVEVTFDIKANIVREGNLNSPGSLPEEEVKEN
jgi:spore germination protein KC